jgi:hypothetical protein
MHINLPFIDENEFVRLHAIVRWVLPILPALAASSPIADSRLTNAADYRLEAYRNNADGFSMIVGQVIPEAILSYAEYQQKILEPMYCEIRPHDPTGLLEQEWLNSRGAIARFDRQSIEIRLLDTQECVTADLAIAAAVIHMIRSLFDSPITTRDFLSLSTERLASILDRCIRMAGFAEIDDEDYLRLWSIDATRVLAGDVWRHALAPAIEPDGILAEWRGPLEHIWQHGTLARRIITRVGNDFSRKHLRDVYRELCDCLDCDRLFQGDAQVAYVDEAVLSVEKDS